MIDFNNISVLFREIIVLLSSLNSAVLMLNTANELMSISFVMKIWLTSRLSLQMRKMLNI